MITIEVNDRSVLDALHKLAGAMADTTPLMADVAGVLLSESERQFASESGPLGAWPGLSDTTKALRAKAGYWPGKTLQQSGQLAASVQVEHGNGWASIGSNKVYAPMQFFGGTTSAQSMIPNKRIPARPFLPMNPETHAITPEAEQTVLEVLSGWLDKIIAN